MQSSRLIFQGKDHKDIYFQGHYHDAMYLGNELLWKKLKKKGNWKFGLADDMVGIPGNQSFRFCKINDTFVAYTMVLTDPRTYYFSRFDMTTKKWVPGPKIPSSIDGVELRYYDFEITSSMIIMEGSPAGLRVQHVFYTKDMLSWNYIGFAETKSSYSSGMSLSEYGTDGTYITARNIRFYTENYLVSINHSGEWKVNNEIFSRYSTFYNGMLLASSVQDRKAEIIRTSDFWRTSENGEPFGSYVLGSKTPKTVGNLCFITIDENGDNESYKIREDGIGIEGHQIPSIKHNYNDVDIVDCMVYNESKGLYGYLIGKVFYESKDGLNWIPVQQNYEGSDSDKYSWSGDSQTSAIYIPGVGYYISYEKCIALCDNPFDELI